MVALAVLGLVAWLRWPRGPVFDCPPRALGLDASGEVRCGGERPLRQGQRRAVGLKVELNRATAQELALLEGIGPQLAQAIVDERERVGGFTRWEQLDGVPGVGPARLQTLREFAEIAASPDAGVL